MIDLKPMSVEIEQILLQEFKLAEPDEVAFLEFQVKLIVHRILTCVQQHLAWRLW